MRFAIIGCGEIGLLRAEALARLKWPLAAVADLDTGRTRVFAQRFRASPHDNWRDCISRKDVDAVLICTPPDLHAEMCSESVKAGKAVLCEKPLGRNPEECRSIVTAATESGKFLATGFNYRFYASIQKAKEMLDSGAIGRLDHIRSYAGYSALDHGHEWIHDFSVMGGGALRDNGIHLIDLTRYFLGEVTEVKSFASNSVWHYQQCEDNGFLLLRNDSGNIASLQASWTEWKGYRFTLEIYGDKGCITASCFPMLLQLQVAPQAGRRAKRRLHVFPKIHLMEHLRSYKWVVIQSFMEELKAFAEAVAGRQTIIATGFDGLRAVEIANAKLSTVSC